VGERDRMCVSVRVCLCGRVWVGEGVQVGVCECVFRCGWVWEPVCVGGCGCVKGCVWGSVDVFSLCGEGVRV
jgi:hypothetical protein